jgi:hypothetical protein
MRVCPKEALGHALIVVTIRERNNMSKELPELGDVRKLATRYRNNDTDSGTHFLLGYLWGTLSHDQRREVFGDFETMVIRECLDEV